MSNEAQSVLNASTDSVASANFIALHEKINANEERLNDINEQTKKKFQIIKENINQIRKKIEEERANSENYTQQKNNCIKSLEEKLADRFNEEQEIRQEIERKFNSLIDEKFISLFSLSSCSILTIPCNLGKSFSRYVFRFSMH